MMMPRNLLEIVFVLTIGFVFAATVNAQYLSVLAAGMVALLALVLVCFLHWRDHMRLSFAAAPTAGDNGDRTPKLD